MSQSAKRSTLEIMNHIEKLIAVGSNTLAAVEFQNLALHHIPRTKKLSFASWARVSGFPFLAIRLLRPLVRPADGDLETASIAENAVYAAALIKIGALYEAIDILEGLSPKEHPEVLLYRAHASIANWDYEAVIPLLNQYLGKSLLSPRERVIGQLNLLASFIHERDFHQALPLIEQLEKTTSEHKMDRFLGNALELSAQYFIRTEQWAEAEKTLASALKVMPENSLDELFVRKWQAILKLNVSTRAGTPISAPLKAIREEAMLRRHWETVRDCDYHLAICLVDKELAIRLCFGTPSEPFCRRLFREFPAPIDLPETFDWSLGPQGKDAKLFDFTQTIELQTRLGLRTSPAGWKIMGVLVSDFYRPTTLPHLFAELHREEYFNPTASKKRIHQSIHTLRDHLKENQSEIFIEQNQGQYRLAARTNTTLRLARRRSEETAGKIISNKLLFTLGDTLFSIHDAAKVLNLTPRHTARLIANAISEGFILRFGAGSATRYHINFRMPPRKQAA